MTTKPCTTAEAAKAVGITRATLQEWIRLGKVIAPKPSFRGAVGVRLWASSDLNRLARVKETIYRKGRGRRPSGTRKPKLKE